MEPMSSELTKILKKIDNYKLELELMIMIKNINKYYTQLLYLFFIYYYYTF